jgi:hypothetical protein
MLPVVMMADFTAAGDQFGCRAFSSATTPATCGVAVDVPEREVFYCTQYHTTVV